MYSAKLASQQMLLASTVHTSELKQSFTELQGVTASRSPAITHTGSAEHSQTPCCLLFQGKWGEDLYSPVPRPMFLVRLVTVAGSLMFDPPLDTIEHGVLQAFDAIVLRSANIDDITTKVNLQLELVASKNVNARCYEPVLCLYA